MQNILNIIKKIIPTKLFKMLQPSYHFILSALSAFLSGLPSNKLIVIGITGTTGKTTSAFLIAKTLEKAGFKVGYTSTAMFNDGNKEWLNDKKMTMPGRFFTQRMLRSMVRNKCQYAIVETTSEGIRQFRHRFINYDILVFTGLYPEHIESHGGFENYKKAKGKLFAHLKNCRPKYANNDNCICRSDSGMKKINLNKIKKTIIVNADDKHAPYFSEFWADIKLGFSRGKDVKLEEDVEIVNYKDIKGNNQGTSFKVENYRFGHRHGESGEAGGTSKKINLQLLGEFNVTNAMTAVCVGLVQALPIEKIKDGLESITGVPGRLEKIDSKKDFTIIVDYAFEPKALSKLYETLDLIPHAKVIHILGSTGGGRDKARRPKLGALAGLNADYIIVTNEDPYDEDPETIIDQVARGVKSNKEVFKILDRREAINKALSLAKKDDIVLLTGKGSEQAICVADGKKIPWDDRTVVKEELSQVAHKS